MQVTTTPLEGVLVIQPKVHGDARGFFLESYSLARYREHGVPLEFVQDNHSRSAKGVLRGLHFQQHTPQGKLLRVTSGSIFDVAVDIDPASPTFKRHVSVELSADNMTQLYVPPGYAHGFCVLSDVADLNYKCTDYFDADDDCGIAWDDPELAIAWPVTKPGLSDKDRNRPTLQAWLAR